MFTYCFKCLTCGARWENALGHLCTGTPEVKRDYRAEGVGIGAGVKVSRDGLVSDQARLFLPSNKDFAGPGDPDGKRGMRKWRDEHQPRGGSRSPHWPGEVERRSF